MSEYLTSIKIFANAPVDETMQDVCIVTSRGAWETELVQYQINAVDNCSYQRDSGVIRYPAPYPALSHANYCSFYNNAHQGNLGQNYRWYAFITGVHYINDNLTELDIKIDPFHTYITELSAGLGYGYVERMHPDTDEPGDNTLDDGLAVGDYVTPFRQFFDLGDMVVIIGSTRLLPAADEPAPGTLLSNGVYSGFKLYGYTAEEAQVLIKGLVDNAKQSCIQFVYMCPALIARYAVQQGFHEIFDDVSPVAFTPAGIPLSTVDGYTPRNKKLLTYPYVGYTLSTPTDSRSFRGEFFGSGIKFSGKGTSSPGGGIILYPEDYAGQGGYQQGVKFTDYPQCSWQSETFNTWLATQGLRQNLEFQGAAVGGLLGGAASLMAGNIAGATKALTNFVFTAQEMSLERTLAKLDSTKLAGSVASQMAEIANDRIGYEFCQMTVRKEVAEAIDSYYDLYGYPIRKIMRITLSTPRHWKYIRTIGYKMQANIPLPYLQMIEDCFNNGFRIWKNPSEFLDYSLDNSPS